MKRRNGEEADRAGEVKAEDQPTPAEEPKGLEGVDASPLPPLSREEVEALRQERDELKDQLLRKRAEFENFRKRVERDRQQAGLEAVGLFLKGLVPTLDNLDRALEAEGGEASLREGVELIRRELATLLERQGVTEEDPTGKPFDPTRHQALSIEEVPGFPEGTVVEVLRKGYSLGDRLLRPALVKVSKGSRPKAGPGAEKVH